MSKLIQRRKQTKLTPSEKKEVEFSEKLIKKVERADLNIDTLKFDTIKAGTKIGDKTYDSDVIIIRQNTVVNN